MDRFVKREPTVRRELSAASKQVKSNKSAGNCAKILTAMQWKALLQSPGPGRGGPLRQQVITAANPSRSSRRTREVHHHRLMHILVGLVGPNEVAAASPGAPSSILAPSSDALCS